MRTALPLILFFPLGGCGTTVDLPDEPPSVPIVEAVLIAGTSTTDVHLAWTDPAGIAPRGRPVSPADARLRLVDAGSGASSTLFPKPDTLGIYTVTLPITAGDRYQLTGTIADRSIEASTVVPTSFQIEQPAADPIAASQPVSFKWSSRGATLFGADRVTFGRSASAYTTATAGTLRIREEGRRTALDFLALNRDAEGYLMNGAIPQSNIQGGTGMLAGAIVVRRALTWQ